MHKTSDFPAKMLADVLEIEEEDVLKAVNMYTVALSLLDDYDHQSLKRPKGIMPTYKITYDRCCDIVDAVTYEVA